MFGFGTRKAAVNCKTDDCHKENAADDNTNYHAGTGILVLRRRGFHQRETGRIFRGEEATIVGEGGFVRISACNAHVGVTLTTLCKQLRAFHTFLCLRVHSITLTTHRTGRSRTFRAILIEDGAAATKRTIFALILNDGATLATSFIRAGCAESLVTFTTASSIDGRACLALAVFINVES